MNRRWQQILKLVPQPWGILLPCGPVLVTLRFGLHWSEIKPWRHHTTGTKPASYTFLLLLLLHVFLVGFPVTLFIDLTVDFLCPLSFLFSMRRIFHLSWCLSHLIFNLLVFLQGKRNGLINASHSAVVTFKKTSLPLIAHDFAYDLDPNDKTRSVLSDHFFLCGHCWVSVVRRVRHVHLVAVVRISALLLLLSLSKVPNISTDPPVVTNQTSATLTCNLTDSSLPIKGSHWLFNGKTVENSESTSSDSFTSLQWVATWMSYILTLYSCLY